MQSAQTAAGADWTTAQATGGPPQHRAKLTQRVSDRFACAACCLGARPHPSLLPCPQFNTRPLHTKSRLYDLLNQPHPHPLEMQAALQNKQFKPRRRRSCCVRRRGPRCRLRCAAPKRPCLRRPHPRARWAAARPRAAAARAQQRDVLRRPGLLGGRAVCWGRRRRRQWCQRRLPVFQRGR